jgi:hypothetical protein
MTRGIIVAKPNATIKSNSDKIYVDSRTPLLKVHIAGSGQMISDGVSRNMQWKGKYQGTTTDIGGNYLFSVVIPHGLGYAPMFIAYMDRNPGINRQYCTTVQSGLGVATTTGVLVFADSDNKNIIITIKSNANFGLNPPDAGVYGYFFYIFNNRISL